METFESGLAKLLFAVSCVVSVIFKIDLRVVGLGAVLVALVIIVGKDILEQKMKDKLAYKQAFRQGLREGLNKKG